MLVLTRKQKEEIRIGDNVTITILRIKGQAVRIGIDAPHDVRVVRGELKVHSSDDESAEDASVEHDEEPAAPPLARFEAGLASPPTEAKKTASSPVSATASSTSSCAKLLREAAKTKSCGDVQRSNCGRSLNTGTRSTLASLVQRRSQRFTSN